MKAFLILLAVCLTATACATAPNYREATTEKSTGYSDQAIEKDRYRVQYRLARDDSGKARDYALLRAAELTLEKGYSTFEVISQSSELRTQEFADPDFEFERDVVVTRDCGLLTCRTTTVPVYTRGELGSAAERADTIVTLEIYLSNKEASISPSLYDASQVVSNLR